MPAAPSDNDTALLKIILNRKIDIYVKRDSILDENLQKAYSLIHGQCNELLKSKLKTSANWETVSSQYDMLGLLDAIKTIINKFEDQKCLPLSLHHAKRNFYAFRQGNLQNTDYLDRFMNLVDMAESYDAKLYDQAMFKIAQDSTVYNTTAEANIQDEKIKTIETTAREIYLACAFVINSDLRKYGRLIEELEKSKHQLTFIMSDIKPSPVKSAYGRGGGRGGGKGGGRGGRGDRSNRSWSGQIQNQKSRPVA